MKKEEIADLLEGLHPDARIIAAERLIGKQPVPDEYVLRILAEKEKQNRFLEGGNLAERARWPQTAIQFYLKGKYFTQIVSVYERMGEPGNALKYSEMTEDHMKTADLAMTVGDKRKALVYLEKAEEYVLGCQLANELGDKKKVIELFERDVKAKMITDHRALAAHAVECCFPERAIEIHELDGNFYLALDVAEEAGIKGKAKTLRTLQDLMKGPDL